MRSSKLHANRNNFQEIRLYAYGIMETVRIVRGDPPRHHEQAAIAYIGEQGDK